MKIGGDHAAAEDEAVRVWKRRLYSLKGLCRAACATSTRQVDMLPASGFLVAYRIEGRIKGEDVSRKTLASSGRFAMFGVRLAFALALGTLLAGCGGSGQNGEVPDDLPASPEEADEVVVRVSGTEGTAYSGTYGTIEGRLQTVDETLGAEPTEYDVEVEEGVADGVTAGFQKTQSGTEALSVEILADGEVVVESRTFAEFGAVNADWFPQIGPPDEIPPDEEILFEDEEVTAEDNP
jgi:hypothetical protein